MMEGTGSGFVGRGGGGGWGGGVTGFAAASGVLSGCALALLYDLSRWRRSIHSLVAAAQAEARRRRAALRREKYGEEEYGEGRDRGGDHFEYASDAESFSPSFT